MALIKKQIIHDHLNEYNYPKKDKKTYYFTLPFGVNLSLLIIETLRGNFNPIITIETGIAYCHPKDRYVKSIGREIAEKNKDLYVYTLYNIQLYPLNEFALLTLNSKLLTLEVKLNLKTYNCKIVNIIYNEE